MPNSLENKDFGARSCLAGQTFAGIGGRHARVRIAPRAALIPHPQHSNMRKFVACLSAVALLGLDRAGWCQDLSVYVPARDGTKLAVDVHFPGRRDAAERVPALLEITRYWRGSEHPSTGASRGSLGGLDRFLLSRGYALVKVDVRGTGASFGSRQAEYGPLEVRDGYDVVDWVIAQPWSDGAVGAYGTSYTGTTAELLAAVKHPAVRAVIPGWSDFDLYTSPARPYGLFASGLIRRWSQMVGWLDANDAGQLGASVRRVDEDEDGEMLRAAVAEHADNPDVFEAVAELDFRDQPMAGGRASLGDCSSVFWKDEIEASGVPMLVLASWLDAGTAEGALRRFCHYSNPQKLVILASSHGGGAHASPYVVGRSPKSPVPSQRELAEMRADFFDHHLRGVDNDVPDWPAVRYFNMGEEAWRETEVWPPAGTKPRRYHFADGGRLVDSAPKAEVGEDGYEVDFSVSTGDANRWMTQMGGPVLRLDDRAEQDAAMLSYTSAPLPSDLQMTGTPVVSLFVTSNREDGAFLVYLEDIGPDGRSRYVTEGGLRAIHRARSKSPFAGQTTPYHSFALGDAKPLVPGELAELSFELHPTSALFRKGHRIRIAIAGADLGSFDRVPADGDVAITVSRNRTHASFVDLPVVER